MKIFAPDHPLVLNGTYDTEGYTPKERRMMTKKQRAAATTNPSPPRRPVTHRVSTMKRNGAESREVAAGDAKISIGEAMRQAVDALGDVHIDPELAASQLEQLAEYYEEVTRRQTAFNARSEEAKTAKKALESATELLLERVRAFTHPASLPLFDQAQAELLPPAEFEESDAPPPAALPKRGRRPHDAPAA